MPSRDARAALLQGVGHLELQLGAFVENGAYQVLESLAVDQCPGTVNDGSVAFGLDKADGLARLALQVPVGKRDLPALAPPAPYDLVGLGILSPAKKHSGGQDILGDAPEEQHEQSHDYWLPP